MLKSQPLKGWGWRVSSLKSTSNYMARSYLKNWWKYWGRAEKLEIIDFACKSRAQTENFFPWPRSGLAQPILLSAYQSVSHCSCHAGQCGWYRFTVRPRNRASPEASDSFALYYQEGNSKTSMTLRVCRAHHWKPVLTVKPWDGGFGSVMYGMSGARSVLRPRMLTLCSAKNKAVRRCFEQVTKAGTGNLEGCVKNGRAHWVAPNPWSLLAPGRLSRSQDRTKDI